jgi:hypothetical protein
MQTLEAFHKCDLCGKPSVADLEFETGNNAEYVVLLSLCVGHLEEVEETGYDFEQKYAAEILECLYDNWRGLGDVWDRENR